jgi:hypothetical protein
MKKIFCILILLLGINFFVFSQVETWTSIGFEFGNSLEQYPDKEVTYLGAPGFNLNLYSFYDLKNIGFFFHFAALFPVIENNSNINSDYSLQYDWIIGPGFRYAVNDNLNVHFGAGFHMTYPLYKKYQKESIDYALIAVNLGIGGDIGLKYDFTDKFYVDFGLTLSYDFFNIVNLYSYSDGGKTQKILSEDIHTMKYALVGVKPYIGIGINIYMETKGKYGKPPKK